MSMRVTVARTIESRMRRVSWRERCDEHDGDLCDMVSAALTDSKEAVQYNATSTTSMRRIVDEFEDGGKKLSEKGAMSKMSIRKMSTSKACLMAVSMYDEVKGEESRGSGAMSELNLAEAQVLVIAWCFSSTSYSSRLSRHYTRNVLLAVVTKLARQAPLRQRQCRSHPCRPMGHPRFCCHSRVHPARLDASTDLCHMVPVAISPQPTDRRPV